MDTAEAENIVGDKQAQGVGNHGVPSTTPSCVQCPLHFAMQRLTRVAVSQLVYYADGEYTPRPLLLKDLDRWQRLHALIATRICPAGRESSMSPDDLRTAQALAPEAQFTALREMLVRCGEREGGDACPLEGESPLEPFSDW